MCCVVFGVVCLVCSVVHFLFNESKQLLNVQQTVQLFLELEGAEGELILRHCLHINVSSYM